MKINRTIINTSLKIITIIFLLSWCALYFAQKIDLTTADLGRHIKNGEMVLNSFNAGVFSTNFYSYTNSDFPFINHHWGSGVVFYLIWKYLGFNGLSVFYILLGTATFFIFFRLARKNSNLLVAAALGSLALPLFASRAEVRPEMFTYFFTGVFFWILWEYHEHPPLTPPTRGGEPAKRAASKSINGSAKDVPSPLWGGGGRGWLYLLPALTLFWVNLHIGFFMGPMLVFIFFVDDTIKAIKAYGQKFYRHLDHLLIIIGLSCGLASLLNPNFIKGALYPLQIFKNYGYLVVENQSIRFLERLNHTAGLNFPLFKAVALILAVSFVLVAIRHRKNFSWSLLIISLVVTAMAALGIRNFPFFALFALVALAYNIQAVYKKELRTKFLLPNFASGSVHIWEAGLVIVCLLIILASGYRDYLRFSQRAPLMGIGLMPYVNASGDFFKANNIQGPVFNNYDVGSYLVYHLFPAQRVFVDNRPEAYPTEFFKDVYVPAQEDEQKWQELDKQENFNAIFFSYRDFTPWGQQFLIARVNDPEWAPVFVDSYNIIFLKRNIQNKDTINRYELPKSMFGVSR